MFQTASGKTSDSDVNGQKCNPSLLCFWRHCLEREMMPRCHTLCRYQGNPRYRNRSGSRSWNNRIAHWQWSRSLPLNSHSLSEPHWNLLCCNYTAVTNPPPVVSRPLGREMSPCGFRWLWESAGRGLTSQSRWTLSPIRPSFPDRSSWKAWSSRRGVWFLYRPVLSARLPRCTVLCWSTVESREWKLATPDTKRLENTTYSELSNIFFLPSPTLVWLEPSGFICSSPNNSPLTIIGNPRIWANPLPLSRRSSWPASMQLCCHIREAGSCGSTRA